MSDEDNANKSCLLCGSELSSNHEALCADCLKRVEIEKKAHKPNAKIGGARSPFGTRVACAITCTECGQRDHIALRPRSGSRMLCRACAEKILGLYEEGRAKPQQTTKIKCSVCGRVEELATHLARKQEEPLCKDCFRGIYSRQEDRSHSAERHSTGTLLARRRRKPEK